MTSPDTVGAQIEAQAPNPMVRLAMRLGALLEGGTLGGGPFEVGDQGTSYGPFQIHLPAHPDVTATEAVDPAFAVHYMLPAYTAAAGAIAPSLWASNPELAAESAARVAERPAQDYVASRGRSTVDRLWSIASGKAPDAGPVGNTDKPGSGGGGPGGCSSPSGVGVVNPFGWAGYLVCKLEEDAKPALFTAAAVLAGTSLVVLGLWRSVARTQTYKTVKQTAATGVMAA